MTDIDDDVKERYDAFVERLTQYMSTPIKDFPSIKPQILNIFKTHRPMKTGDYQYGFSKAGKKKCQLIVHEFSDKWSLVREYFKSGKNDWHCCECNRINASKNDGIIDLIVAHGFVFVKLEHDCKLRELSFVMDIQKLYKNGKIIQADALQKSILGSEDLNVLSNKAVTRGKKATKLINKTPLDEDLQCAAENNKNAQELQPSIMDEFLDENEERLLPDVIFAKIIENLHEYTKDKLDSILKNKSRITTILKTHCPVKSANYLYGLTVNLRVNQRLVVFEWNDRRRVREYSKTKDICIWDCLECYRMWRWHNTSCKEDHVWASLYFINGIIFVPFFHKCPPRDYRFIMQYQKFLEEGDTTKARSMSKKDNFIYGESSFTNVVNVLEIETSSTANTTSTEKGITINDYENNSKTLTNLKRKLPSTNKAELDEHKDAKPVKKPKKNKENYVDEKFNLVNETEPVPSTSIFAFEKPSALMFEEICAKLNIQYRNRAMKLWDKIVIEQIDTVSMPLTNTQNHYFETENFYQILSIFFTGKSKQHEQIKITIIEAFRKKMVESGEVSARKFDKHYTKDTVTDRHLSFIAKFLPCRILIFDDKEGIRKYGKWKETSRKRVTLVVSFFDGLYSIVLNL